MFSHAELAIFTKNGTLLPFNLKSEIKIIIKDDYNNQAVFYPITEKDENGNIKFLYNKRIYGGRFLKNASSRMVTIMHNEHSDYKKAEVQYEEIVSNSESDTIYTISNIKIDGWSSGVCDSKLVFPNVTISQKLIFDKVSTELFETEFLFVVAKTEESSGVKSYKKISSLIGENIDNNLREWAQRYKLLFFIDCRNQKDFRIFTVTGDEAIWSDRAELDLLNDSVIISDETNSITSNYPTNLTNTYTSTKSPRIDIGFSGENEGVYEQVLHICLLDKNNIDDNGIPDITPIGEIKLIAETEGEDERYRTLFTNFGIPDPANFDYVYKDSYIDDEKPDYISINKHSKEMFLEYDKIFPYIGTYKALINAVHLLGYNDIFFKEWYKILDVSDEIPRGYIAYDMSYKNSGHNNTLAALPIEKRVHLRKKNWLSMLFSLNREIYGPPDEYDFPYVEELFEYRTEDSLLKLIALREWLEKYVMALNCRIIDVGGEGVYFERYDMRGYGGLSENLEHDANLNLIPVVADSSSSDTVVLEDSSAVITIKADMGFARKTFEDFSNLKFEDFCEGVITDNNTYHIYDGSTEGRYIGTIIAGYDNRYTGRLTAVSDVKDFIFGEDGFISKNSPRIIITDNEISFIPEDIVYKEKNTAFLKMPVIALEHAILRSFTDTWKKPVRYLIYPENDVETGISYIIENKISKKKVYSADYVYLIPPTNEEDDNNVTIIMRNNSGLIPGSHSTAHPKRKHYNFTSDFGGVVKEYTSNDTTYGFRFSANNAYEIPLISIQGYSVKKPVNFELPVEQEYYLDIIKGKLIFDDFEHNRRIYVIFDINDNGERTINVKTSYFGKEFVICKYNDGNHTFEHFSDGENYTDFLNLYDDNIEEAVDYNLYKDIRVYNSGEFKVNLTVYDVYGEVYSADAYNTAKVITQKPLINAYTNEPVSNNEYNKNGRITDSSTIYNIYNDFCYFQYKTKYPIISANTTEAYNLIKYPIYPYSNNSVKSGMISHYSNLCDKFKIVAYDKFIRHEDRIDWNYYLILNRQNRYKNTRIVEKNDKGALRELYSGDINVGIGNMAQKCCELFDDAERVYRENGPIFDTSLRSENLDVTVLFYNEVGEFPVLQIPGKILNAKALDNLQIGSGMEEHPGTPYGYYDDEYHLLISNDITNCYIYTPTDDIKTITSIIDSRGDIYTGLTFIQDNVEWLVKSPFSEGYGSLWEYDCISGKVTIENHNNKHYAYADVDLENIDAFEGYYYTPSGELPESSTGVVWNPVEFEDMPWVSGWLTYKGKPVLSKTFIDLDTSISYNVDYKIPAGMLDSSLRYRVPSFDAKIIDNSIYSPYYAVEPNTLMDRIIDIAEDSNISVYIYPYWQSEIRIIGVSENRVYVQFENSKYKFPRAFKSGEVVKLIWQTGGLDASADVSNCIGQSSYRVIGYDNLGFVLILEGEINPSFANVPGKKYAYATIDVDLYEGTDLYDISTADWNPKEYEDMPDGWITGWLMYNGSVDFTYTYEPEKSYYRDHEELYYTHDSTHYGVGQTHLHIYRIPAGKHIDPITHKTTIMYRVISHDDLKCAWPLHDENPNEGLGIDPNGMFFPYYYKFESVVDASLFISYAHNAFVDYKLPVLNSNISREKTEVMHPISLNNDKLTYFIDDTFKSVCRTFDVDNGILFWMNSSDGEPLICHNDIYSYNCPVSVFEKTPYAAFNTYFKNTMESSESNDKKTVLWKVYKSEGANEKTLLFESWNKSLFLDITERGVYDIEVNEFDKYGNRATHMYEGAYRILSSESDKSTIYNIEVNTEIDECVGEYGYVTGGGFYEEGMMCVLKAVAYEGYEFVGWSIGGAIVETNSILMFIVSGSSKIRAKFKIKHFTVNIDSNKRDMGFVTIYPDGELNDDGIYTYSYGTLCTMIATPNYYDNIDDTSVSYRFVKWEYNGETVSNDLEYKFIVNEDCSVRGVFSDRTFSIITKSNNTEYGIALSTHSICTPGEKCSFIAKVIDSNNYEFLGWYENNNKVEDNSVFNVSVTRDYNMLAKFGIKKPNNNYVFKLSFDTLNADNNVLDASNEYDLYVNDVLYDDTSTYEDVYGAEKTLEVLLKPNVSNPKYYFVGWYLGSTLLSKNSIYNYSLQLPSVTLIAKFDKAKKLIVNSFVDSTQATVTPESAYVYLGGSVEIILTCNELYELDMENTTIIDVDNGERELNKNIMDISVNGDPYVYTIILNNIYCNINIEFSCKIRNNELIYEPFYITTEEGNSEERIRITPNILISDNNSYYECMIESEPDIIYNLNPDNPITVPCATKVYIWAKQARNVASNGNPAFNVIKIKKDNSEVETEYIVGGYLISLLVPTIVNGLYVNYSTQTLTNLNKNCFYGLFANTKIKRAKELIVPTNVVEGCFREMFKNASLLLWAPELRATSLTYYAYRQMFEGCKSLQMIKTLQNSWEIEAGGNIDLQSIPTYHWVNNINKSDDGSDDMDHYREFHCIVDLPDQRGPDYIPEYWIKKTIIFNES